MNHSFPIDDGVLLVAGLLVVATLVVGTSDRLRVPAAVLSLVLGMLFGSDVLGVVALDNASLVRDISIVALVVILFEGGLTTKPRTIRESGLAGGSLATFGVLMTAAVTAAGAVAILGVGWRTGWLIGAVVASTDAAVVFDLIRKAPLPPRLAGILEVESGLNDPVAVLLTIGLVELATAGFDTTEWLWFGLRQIMGGALVGVLVGVIGSRLLRVRLRSEGLYPLLALGLAGISYASAAWIGGSGFLACYVTGLLIGALAPRHRRVIRGFHASLANGAEMAMFLVLGLLVFPSRLPSIALPALGVTAVLLLVARPVAVWVSMLPFGLNAKQKTLLSWAGLRGAVPIVLATIPATSGIAGGDDIFNIVFFVVLVSTLVQGTTVAPLARRLGLAFERPPWRSVAEAIPLESPDVDLVELEITPDLMIVGSRLADAPPPDGMLLTTLVHDGRASIPNGDTVFQQGDLIVLAIDRRMARVADATAWARGEPV
jgi:potassium/hydrogen antiporter